MGAGAAAGIAIIVAATAAPWPRGGGVRWGSAYEKNATGGGGVTPESATVAGTGADMAPLKPVAVVPAAEPFAAPARAAVASATSFCTSGAPPANIIVLASDGPAG